MNVRLLISTAAVAALLSTAGASAQGWYVSVLGGPTLEQPHITLGGANGYRSTTGFNAGGRIGYDLDSWVPWQGFSLEGDVFYTQAHLDASDTAQTSSLSGMGNLIYHVNTGWPVGIYGGAGAGAVSTRLRSGDTEDSSTVFGWQGIGGVDYAFAPDTKLFAEYRYLNARDANLVLPGGGFGRVGNTSNNVSVGLKFEM
ncbi:MAG: outer membrane beta-barrel protein [Rhizomicrobium sp.]